MLRSLAQAHYDTERWDHSGLGSPAYLHFTSPIRRYPDLLVHRALLATLDGESVAPTAQELSEAAFTCSEVERELAHLERPCRPDLRGLAPGAPRGGGRDLRWTWRVRSSA